MFTSSDWIPYGMQSFQVLSLAHYTLLCYGTNNIVCRSNWNVLHINLKLCCRICFYTTIFFNVFKTVLHLLMAFVFVCGIAALQALWIFVEWFSSWKLRTLFPISYLFYITTVSSFQVFFSNKAIFCYNKTKR